MPTPSSLQAPGGSGDQGNSRLQRVPRPFVRLRKILAKVLIEEGHHKKTYTITGNQPLSMVEATQILAQAGHPSIEFHPVSERKAPEFLEKAGKPDWLIEVLMELFDAFRSGAASLSVDTIEKMLGRPPVSFEQLAAHQGTF